MNINATIFVQIVHFLFAYFILRRFLLRPIANIIFGERAYRKNLQENIEQEERNRVHKQEQQIKQWHMFQQVWRQQIPSLQDYHKKIPIELGIKKTMLPHDVFLKEAQKIAEQIKERVDYAR